MSDGRVQHRNGIEVRKRQRISRASGALGGAMEDDNDIDPETILLLHVTTEFVDIFYCHATSGHANFMIPTTNILLKSSPNE